MLIQKNKYTGFWNYILPFYGICRRKHKRHDLFFIKHPIVVHSDICAFLSCENFHYLSCKCAIVLLICRRGNPWTLKMPYYTHLKGFVFHALQSSTLAWLCFHKNATDFQKHHILPSVMSHRDGFFFFALWHKVWEKWDKQWSFSYTWVVYWPTREKCW